MQVVAEIAMDREPDALVDRFVHPLHETLQAESLGRVTYHSWHDLLTVEVKLTVTSMTGFDRILQFLAEADAPLGTVVYQVGWFGRKKNIVVLGS